MIEIYNWQELSLVKQTELLSRPVSANKASLVLGVKDILSKVKQKGDKALFEFTSKFDGVDLDNIEVSTDEIKNAYSLVSEDDINLVKSSIARISNYHEVMKPKTTVCDTNDGVVCKKIYKPIEKVGLYVPGGSAPLVSTLIMLAAPAQIAGCKEIYVTTPCDKEGNIHPLILIAADICKVSKIYKLGGAQAIAALAYGTETVTKVNKIYGPGNSWVTEAKQQVSNDSQGAAIDLPAGPSEVLVVADESADPRFVAADLLAQAEHGTDSQALLITTSQVLANKVRDEVSKQTSTAQRKAIIEKALENSSIIVVDTLSQAINIANEYASEHLILNIETADNYIDSIENAGAVFVGPWAAEALGDYITGSNHVLPTYGYAKAYSGLATIDFMKAISIQNVSKQGIKNIGQIAMRLADIEGLKAHENAIAIRLESL
ncbi:histidinol dehydrogenase [Francisella philomiragia]|uniref:Histidinol dehydrogenase n=1 Tax=Francisella philomiragia TaxID=28110 RepID=A0AAW3DBA5_9GAMM|nr:histidinol dehydrogenase [Francisella philomiragia]KFJ42447.1 histidinol dehydrogenase [Francisella philomiragia]MBK2254198.1 histidinol dehydrogenase [Francisella philomiragia]MBK2272510.1 histidinol dehydrogenase [Francisella philomiragia]MBK2276352.1 histidinol dehydrogenase [Francisella philomiragia]MBK2280299.1 histidinol dehydrogenase [Francisella philomiragia]